jgi:hypothetical protein
MAIFFASARRSSNPMPDSYVRDLIAHELANVYYGAIGQLAVDPSEEESAEEEHLANELTLQWGFSPWGMDEWLEEVGLAEHPSS